MRSLPRAESRFICSFLIGWEVKMNHQQSLKCLCSYQIETMPNVPANLSHKDELAYINWSLTRISHKWSVCKERSPSPLKLGCGQKVMGCCWNTSASKQDPSRWSCTQKLWGSCWPHRLFPVSCSTYRTFSGRHIETHVLWPTFFRLCPRQMG